MVFSELFELNEAQALAGLLARYGGNVAGEERESTWCVSDEASAGGGRARRRTVVGVRCLGGVCEYTNWQGER